MGNGAVVTRVVMLSMVVLSFVGFVLYLSIKHRVHMSFSPALVASTIGVIMLIAGILNIMFLSMLSLVLIGNGIFLYMIVRAKIRVRDLLAPSNILLLGFVVYMGWRLYSIYPTHYDNFSHWLTVTKYLFKYDELPSFKSNMIQFQAYPTGTAGFIYYTLRLFGFREDIILLSQSVLMIMFFLPLTAYAENNKDNKFLSWVAVMIALMVMMAHLSVFQSLLVDDLLAFCGLGGISIVLYYRKDPKRALFCVIPICAFLVFIKNSGVFFVLLMSILLLIIAARQKAGGRFCWKVVLLTMLLPIFLFFLWTKHVSLVFETGMESKHAMSVASYLDAFSKQDTSAIADRFVEIVRRMVDWSNHKVRSMVFTLIISLFVLLLTFYRSKNLLIRYCFLILFASFFIYFLWGVSLAGMYTFSMKGAEAETLAGFTRYLDTIVVFIHGMFFVCILLYFDVKRDIMHASKSNLGNIGYRLVCLIAFLAVVVPLTYTQDLFRIWIKRPTTGDRITIQEHFGKREIPEGVPVLVISDTDRIGYLYYLSRFEFWTNDVDLRRVDNQANLREVLNSNERYSYVVISLRDEMMNQTVADYIEKDVGENDRIIIL